jgi:hypothetical protein
MPVLAIATVLIAGCGSSNPSGSDSAAATKRSSIVAFARCMRSHGVPNFPDPGGNGRGGLEIQGSQTTGSGASMMVNGVAVNGPAFQSAMHTCHSYLPNGGRPSASQSASERTAALAMARCMRSHGVPNFPDPTFGTGPGGGVVQQFQPAPGSAPNKGSPAFQAAQRACQPLLAKASPNGAAGAKGP